MSCNLWQPDRHDPLKHLIRHCLPLATDRLWRRFNGSFYTAVMGHLFSRLLGIRRTSRLYTSSIPPCSSKPCWSSSNPSSGQSTSNHVYWYCLHSEHSDLYQAIIIILMWCIHISAVMTLARICAISYISYIIIIQAIILCSAACFV